MASAGGPIAAGHLARPLGYVPAPPRGVARLPRLLPGIAIGAIWDGDIATPKPCSLRSQCWTSAQSSGISAEARRCRSKARNRSPRAAPVESTTSACQGQGVRETAYSAGCGRPSRRAPESRRPPPALPRSTRAVCANAMSPTQPVPEISSRMPHLCLARAGRAANLHQRARIQAAGQQRVQPAGGP
jgi:hypothetical protein